MSKHGDALLAPDAIADVKERLLPLATLVTPNLPEAGLLTGYEADDEAGMVAGGRGDTRARPTVGAREGRPPRRANRWTCFSMGSRCGVWPRPRVSSRHTHGTGCTLASAIACYLACGADVPDAVARAKEYVTGAIRAGFPLGRTAGIGPVDHAWRWRPGLSG